MVICKISDDFQILIFFADDKKSARVKIHLNRVFINVIQI